MVTTVLNITELIGIVEKNEYQIYKAVHNMGRQFRLKDYRKIQSERQNYKTEIDTMILEIKEAYDNHIEIIDIDNSVIEEFRKNICNNNCDIFDFISIEYLKSIGVKNYISDDKDFIDRKSVV